jgi:hypothetical protein
MRKGYACHNGDAQLRTWRSQPSYTTYADLGTHFLDRLEPQRLTRYYVKYLQRLGHKVTLETPVAA